MNKKMLGLLAIPLVAAGAFGVTNFVSAQSNNVASTTATSQVEKADTAGVDESTENKALQAKAKITAEEAKAKAQSTEKGTVTKAELEEENGKIVYSVLINDKEVKVDAVNGTVVSVGSTKGREAEDAESNEKETNEVKDNNSTSAQ